MALCGTLYFCHCPRAHGHVMCDMCADMNSELRRLFHVHIRVHMRNRILLHMTQRREASHYAVTLVYLAHQIMPGVTLDLLDDGSVFITVVSPDPDMPDIF
jgi:hypothetical protein